MAGPYQPYRQVGAEGQPLPYPDDQYDGPAAYPGVYPGMLPPPVGYPKPRRSRTLWLSLLVLVLAGAIVAAVLTIRADRPATGAALFTEPAVKTAIQNYLSALSNGDLDVIARNNLCGLYDGVKDRRSDQALARLSSDAFRRQFVQAEVTSIDKIVPSSNYQAQVLFTMKVAPTSGSRNARADEQGVAQVLRQDNKLLVCSYLLRTAAQY